MFSGSLKIRYICVEPWELILVTPAPILAPSSCRIFPQAFDISLHVAHRMRAMVNARAKTSCSAREGSRWHHSVCQYPNVRMIPDAMTFLSRVVNVRTERIHIIVHVVRVRGGLIILSITAEMLVKYRVALLGIIVHFIGRTNAMRRARWS